MSFRADSLRLAAGRPGRGRLTPFLACALMLVFVGVPAAAQAHHHADPGVPGDDLSCSLCLWQAHAAAEPATGCSLAPAAATDLAPTPRDVPTRTVSPAHACPRAPPSLPV